MHVKGELSNAYRMFSFTVCMRRPDEYLFTLMFWNFPIWDERNRLLAKPNGYNIFPIISTQKSVQRKCRLLLLLSCNRKLRQCVRNIYFKFSKKKNILFSTHYVYLLSTLFLCSSVSVGTAPHLIFWRILKLNELMGLQFWCINNECDSMQSAFLGHSHVTYAHWASHCITCTQYYFTNKYTLALMHYRAQRFFGRLHLMRALR